MAWKWLARNLRQIGPYDILAKLGKGGTGSVYKARHQATGDLVALKVVGPEVATDSVLRRRFEQEFRAAHRLEQPHIVRCLDFGQDGGLLYLVMELVEGQSLGETIRLRGRLPETEAVALISQVAHALHQIHEQAMVHRDVKPDNILLAPDGRAMLTDFGVVKDLDTPVAITTASSFLGTPNFMAPEQFTDPKAVDRRCDVYSLAATLYMALTGEVPFRGRGCLSVLRLKIEGEILPPRQLVLDLTPAVDWAIRRALSPSPEQRPASCPEFIKNLIAGDLGADLAAPVGSTAAAALPQPLPTERRTSMRFPCGLSANCRPIGGGNGIVWEARARDISTGGICLALGRRVEPRTSLLVDLRGAGEDFPSWLLMRVTRVQGQGPRDWLIGGQWLQGLSADDLRCLP